MAISRCNERYKDKISALLRATFQFSQNVLNLRNAIVRRNFPHYFALQSGRFDFFGELEEKPRLRKARQKFNFAAFVPRKLF